MPFDGAAADAEAGGNALACGSHAYARIFATILDKGDSVLFTLRFVMLSGGVTSALRRGAQNPLSAFCVRAQLGNFAFSLPCAGSEALNSSVRLNQAPICVLVFVPRGVTLLRAITIRPEVHSSIQTGQFRTLCRCQSRKSLMFGSHSRGLIVREKKSW